MTLGLFQAYYIGEVVEYIALYHVELEIQYLQKLTIDRGDILRREDTAADSPIDVL